MESHKRTLLKTFSWRFIAMCITAVLAWLITGEPMAGLTIGVVDTLVKFAAYYFHERAWTKVPVGYNVPPTSQDDHSNP